MKIFISLFNIFFIFTISVSAQNIVNTNDKNNINKAILKKSKNSNTANKEIESLMISPINIQKIKQAIDALKTGTELNVASTDEAGKVAKNQTLSNSQSSLYLNSILYLNKTNWSVWINGKKISYQNNKKDNEIYITSINIDKIEVLWTLTASRWKVLRGNLSSDEQSPRITEDNKVETLFEIQVNQTYRLTVNEIFEGKIL